MKATGHRVYIEGMKGLTHRLTRSLPFMIKIKMERALDDTALIIRDGIVEHVGHHQHPHGIPQQDLGDSTGNRHWFPPARRKHEFSHEYLGDPLVNIDMGIVKDYDWKMPLPDTHYWPYNRLGELAGSLKKERSTPPGTFGMMTFIVDTPYAHTLEIMNAGQFSFLTPTIFERSRVIFDQFKGAMLNVVRKYS